MEYNFKDKSTGNIKSWLLGFLETGNLQTKKSFSIIMKREAKELVVFDRRKARKETSIRSKGFWDVVTK